MKKLFLLAFLFCLPVSVLAQKKVIYDVSDEYIPIVKNCEKPAEEGGWGGTCRDSIWNAGAANTIVNGCKSYFGPLGNNEEFVGYCGIDGDQCCLDPEKVPVDPPESMYETSFITDNLCEKPVSEGGYGGECNDQDNSLTYGLAGTDETCASGDQFVAYCDQGLDSKAGCCVPTNGEYCKKLAEETGKAVCGTSNTTAAGIGESDYKLLELIPGSNNTSGKLQPYLESLYRAGFVLIILGAVFMITVGGFTYMASAGNTYAIKKGKGMITDAVLGLVIALFVWLILNIINPDLVNLKIDPLPGVSFDTGGAGAGIAANGSTTSSLSAQEAAKKLLASPNVTLYTSSGNNCPGGNASAKDNLEQVAAGNGMTRCPCGGGGTVAPSATLLNSLVDIANTGTNFQINFIAGGCHSEGSNHYSGNSVDIQRTSALDEFFSKYPKTDNSPTHQVSGVKVWFEDSSHYHVSLSGR